MDNTHHNDIYPYCPRGSRIGAHSHIVSAVALPAMQSPMQNNPCKGNIHHNGIYHACDSRIGAHNDTALAAASALSDTQLHRFHAALSSLRR